MNKTGFNLIKEYNKENKRLCNHRGKVACCLIIIFVPLFGVLDRFISPVYFSFFMKMRLGVSFIVAILLVLEFTRIGKKYPEILGIIFFTSVGIMIAHMTRYLGGYKSSYYAGLNLVFLTMILMAWRLRYSIITCFVIYGFYLIPIILFDKIDNFSLLLNNNFFLVTTITVALTNNYTNYHLRFQEFRARYNLGQAKANLETAYSKLTELDKLKTQFFSNISHEFRTPLTLILAPIESMLQGKLGMLSPRAKEEAGVIYDNSLRLLKLIDDLLDITKIDAQKMELDLEKGDISELIKGILASVKSVAEKKKLNLFYTQKSKVSPFYFDQDKIEKVLLNLVANALKFTNKGEIEIISEKMDEKAIIKVRDTGIGVADEELPKMFNRFMQVDGGATRRHEGTGIGLALSKELVELHKGNISIASRPGKGTTMIVEFPLNLVPKGEISRADKTKDDWIKDIHKKAQFVGQGGLVERVKIKERSIPKKNKAGYTILVVEDNPDMLNFVTLQLKDSYEVLGASNGEEGLELAQKHLPDLIISDIMMPKMSGYDLLEVIRKDYQLKNIPLIFLTAKAGVDMKIEGLEYGADDYLVKPFNSQELLARVKNIITNREMRQLYMVAKLTSVEQLVAETAHEIKNPLASIKTFTEFLAEKRNDKVFIEKFQQVVSREVERINAMAHRLLDFRPRAPNLKPEDIHKIIDDTLVLINNDLDKKKIGLKRDYTAQISSISADASQLEQVFLNLFLNSIDAMEEKGTLKVETSSDKGNVIIKISDTGKGIPQNEIPRLFEPFYTTKEKGTGLGLSIVHGIIKNHNGSIEVESQLNKGTTFIIKLPFNS